MKEKLKIFGTVPKSNRLIVERGKNDTLFVHDSLITTLGTGTAI